MTGGANCVLIAEAHPGLAEGMRDLLRTTFDVVVIVADEPSLIRSVERLAPRLAIVDLALGRGDIAGLIRKLRTCCPAVRVVVLGVHDEPNAAQSTRLAEADGFIVKWRIASDLLPMIDSLLREERSDATRPDATTTAGKAH